jgi:putative component of membrane protein insertase Oxa1/YidC/SpoIIIJ protein YidD
MKRKFFFILFLCVFAPLCLICAEPWGKDADLAYKIPAKEPIKQCQTPLLGSLSEVLIQFHQDVISPADGPRSNFIPSSSQYTLDAMRKYGFFTGVAMGCDRLMRENDDPWIYRKIYNSNGRIMKWDPVQ